MGITKGKQIRLIGSTFEGYEWSLRVTICLNSKCFIGSFNFGCVPNKHNQRQRDRQWVHNNIPSSIWWGAEIHHNWKDGGRMYLLSKEEHKRRTKEEKKNG